MLKIAGRVGSMAPMSVTELGEICTRPRLGAVTGTARTPVVAHGIRPALPRQDIPRRERFAWRARIRANPAALVAYRAVVGVLGAGLIIAALLLGWLPGPGGTPLFLAGMAVLASEFRWAHVVTVRAMWLLRRLRSAPTAVQASILSTAGLLLVVMAWSGLVLLGLPSWTPTWLVTTLGQIPGIGG